MHSVDSVCRVPPADCQHTERNPSRMESILFIAGAWLGMVPLWCTLRGCHDRVRASSTGGTCVSLCAGGQCNHFNNRSENGECVVAGSTRPHGVSRSLLSFAWDCHRSTMSCTKHVAEMWWSEPTSTCVSTTPTAVGCHAVADEGKSSGVPSYTPVDMAVKLKAVGMWHGAVAVCSLSYRLTLLHLLLELVRVRVLLPRELHRYCPGPTPVDCSCRLLVPWTLPTDPRLY